MKKPHKFDADFSSVLLSDERAKQGTSESIIKFSKITKRDVAVDFGCGPGFLTIPLAKKCRFVYAIDINQRMLETIALRSKKEGAPNIKPVKSTEYSVRLPESADFLFALSLVHEVVRKRKMFEVFHKLLKIKGSLIVADWRTDAKEWEFGPALHERISKTKMVELAAGLFKPKREKLMENQYYLLFEKV